MKKKFAAKIFANYIHKKNQKWINNPLSAQQKTFNYLIQKAKTTDFGRDHRFDKIKELKDFQIAVPIRDYEGHRPYVDKMLEGRASYCGQENHFITPKPVERPPVPNSFHSLAESMPTHITAARDALLNYIHQTGNTDFVDGKQIFSSGKSYSQKRRQHHRETSGIVAHYVPNYLQKNRMPSWDTNCIEDWETKVDAIVEETLPENMSLIAGIPSGTNVF